MQPARFMSVHFKIRNKEENLTSAELAGKFDVKYCCGIITEPLKS